MVDFYLCAGVALQAVLVGNIGNGLSADDHDIEEIIVEGKRLSLDKLDAVKTPTPIIDIPQSLSIVGGEQIAAQAFTNIGDITRYSPGLSVSQGEGHRDSIIIRGTQTTADFFIDGVRDDVQYFRPLYNLEQVEILRGANALLFGRGGGGGVINRVTKRPEFGSEFIGYNATVDTFGALSVSGDANYQIADNVAFRLNGFYEKLNNHRDFFEGERFAVNPTLAFKASDDTEFLLSYEYVDDDRVIDRGVPSVAVANGPDVPLEGFDNTFFGSPDENVTRLQAHILKARLDHSFSDFLRGNFTAQYAEYDKLYNNLFAVGFRADPNGAGNLLTLDGYSDPTERENLILQANLIGEFDTGSISHTILFGAEYGNQDTTNQRLDNLFDSNGDGIFDPSLVVNGVVDDDRAEFLFSDPLDIPAFSFSDLGRDRASQVEFVSLYAQDQFDVTDWLKVVVGLRYDQFDIEVTDFIEVRNGESDGNDGLLSRVDNEVSPRFGIIIKPEENVSLYGSYSESFLPRSGEQFLTLSLTSEALEPQSFKNVEFGAKWDITDSLNATVAFFRLDRENETTVDPLDVGNTLVLAGVVTKGVEVALSGALTNWWSVNTNFSYLDGEVDGGVFDNNRTRQTPETMFSIWNIFQATEQLGFGVGLTNQSSFFVREDNAVEVPGFTRFDAAFYYDVNETLRLQLNAENLFNTDYFPDAHSNDNISTGKPFNVRFSVSGRF